ncbi:hypothetical protein P9112_011648 [Eukaryota sp. TZLM1-RC]
MTESVKKEKRKRTSSKRDKTSSSASKRKRVVDTTPKDLTEPKPLRLEDRFQPESNFTETSMDCSLSSLFSDASYKILFRLAKPIDITTLEQLTTPLSFDFSSTSPQTFTVPHPTDATSNLQVLFAVLDSNDLHTIVPNETLSCLTSHPFTHLITISPLPNPTVEVISEPCSTKEHVQPKFLPPRPSSPSCNVLAVTPPSPVVDASVYLPDSAFEVIEKKKRRKKDKEGRRKKSKGEKTKKKSKKDKKLIE